MKNKLLTFALSDKIMEPEPLRNFADFFVSVHKRRTLRTSPAPDRESPGNSLSMTNQTAGRASAFFRPNSLYNTMENLTKPEKQASVSTLGLCRETADLLHDLAQFININKRLQHRVKDVEGFKNTQNDYYFELLELIADSAIRNAQYDDNGEIVAI